MKTIQLKLYTFKELGRTAKQRALTEFRHLNIGFDWWVDEYEDFVNLCATLGITVDRGSLKFSGFHAQGDGSAFSASLDFARLPEAIRLQAWKAYAPLQEFRFPELQVDRRVLGLVGNGILPNEMQIIARQRVNAITVNLGIYVVQEYKTHDNLFEELDKLEDWLRAVADTLNRYLYETLRRQYEFLTADSTLKESILLNEYLFSADGRAANHLYQLALHHHKTE